MNILKTVLLLVLVTFISLAGWQLFRNNQLDKRIQQLEIEKALSDQEVSKAKQEATVIKEQLDSFEEESANQIAELHTKNQELETKVGNSDRVRARLSSELADLENQLASIPPTPPEVVEEYCPELPVIQKMNSVLKEDILELEFQLDIKNGVIQNKNIEIALSNRRIIQYQTYVEAQDKIIVGLEDSIRIRDEQIKAYKKKGSRWLPKPMVGVAGTCGINGDKCVFGPTIGLGWTF